MVRTYRQIMAQDNVLQAVTERVREKDRTSVMEPRTLVLTPWYTPHKIVPWQKAVTQLFTGDVEVVEEYDDMLCSPSLSMRTPSVVRLKRPIGKMKRGVKFSRQNVLTRDGFQCQYCGTKGDYDTLNYDHVMPRHQGGKTDWENIVASCYPCNGKKANRTPEQAGMVLISRPKKPHSLPLHAPLRTRDVHPSWENYVGR